MERVDNILNRYYTQLDKLKGQLERYGDPVEYKDQSQSWRQRHQKIVMEEAREKQAEAKKIYIEALNMKISKAEEEVQTEIPDVLKQKMAFTEDELIFLTRKYADNYFAVKRIEQIAADLGHDALKLNMEVNADDPMKELSKLQRMVDSADQRFRDNPFHDTPQGQIEATLGIYQ